MASRAEELGFGAVMLADHLLMDFAEVPERLGMADSITLLAALAASTNRVRLAPIVAATAYRNPALLANVATTIDEISAATCASMPSAAPSWCPASPASRR